MVTGYEVLIADINRVLQNERVLIAAANSVLAAQKDRIFNKGDATNGSKIGQYSTKPISISRRRQARQTGKTRFTGGYREYKSLTGKEASFVNLQDTGQMMMDLGTTIVGRGEVGIGFSNQFNADKSYWAEEKYKKEIFFTSDKEDDLFDRVIQFELDRQL
jgi:hypothetical protein